MYKYFWLSWPTSLIYHYNRGGGASDSWVKVGSDHSMDLCPISTQGITANTDSIREAMERSNPWTNKLPWTLKPNCPYVMTVTFYFAIINFLFIGPSILRIIDICCHNHWVYYKALDSYALCIFGHKKI